MVKTVSLDIVREDTSPDEYLGGQQTIKVVVPTTAPEEETSPISPPLIISASPSGSYPEGQPIGGTLLADRTVTWSRSGVDAYAVSLNPSTGVWKLEDTDFATKKNYAFTFTATDTGGRTAQQVVAIAITQVVVTPTLTLTGPLTYAADAAAGTTVANIGNVPAGSTPTISPNDGRLAIAGNANDGWRVVKGLSASTAGTITLTASAPGANSASATVTITAAQVAFANLALVSNDLFHTDAGQTWWSTQHDINPAQTIAVSGTTDSTGLQYIAEIGVASRQVIEMRRIEFPRFFTPDEHQSVCPKFTPNGALWVSVQGHNNAVTATAANQGRILILYSATGRIADLQVAHVLTMDNTSSTAGAQYGQWRVISDNELVLYSHNDAIQGLKVFHWKDGNYKNPVQYRHMIRLIPQGGNGQQQYYGLATPISATVDRIYCQPHPTNTRNRIGYVDYNIATGEITSGATSFGSMYEGTGTVVNWSATPIAIAYDPGAGNSFRLMYAKGLAIGGCHYRTSDGANARFIHIENGQEVELGRPGLPFDAERFYFRTLAIAREPHSGYRWYVPGSDDAGNDWVDKVETPALGQPLTRTRMFNTNTGRILRVWDYGNNATDDLAIAVHHGRFTSYTNFQTGYTPLPSYAEVSGAPAPTTSITGGAGIITVNSLADLAPVTATGGAGTITVAGA